MRLLPMRYLDMRKMTTHHISTSRERVVRLVDRISAQHNGIATHSSLRIHYSVSTDDSGAAFHSTAQVEAAEQHEHMPRQVSFHLYRAEEAGRVMHLLTRRDINIFTKISPISRRLA